LVLKQSFGINLLRVWKAGVAASGATWGRKWK
jgi:hypothetical protein